MNDDLPRAGQEARRAAAAYLASGRIGGELEQRRGEVLDPIPPGLDKDACFAQMQQGIEAATARLVAEGVRDLAEAGRDPSLL